MLACKLATLKFKQLHHFYFFFTVLEQPPNFQRIFKDIKIIRTVFNDAQLKPPKWYISLLLNCIFITLLALTVFQQASNRADQPHAVTQHRKLPIKLRCHTLLMMALCNIYHALLRLGSCFFFPQLPVRLSFLPFLHPSPHLLLGPEW